MNLLSEFPNDLHPYELWLVLDRKLGGRGFYSGAPNNKLHLPNQGSDCRLVLDFKENQIASIERGPAFDATEWISIKHEIVATLITGSRVTGREISFSSSPVSGSWTGLRSGVQILPPPVNAPQPPFGCGEHPFTLEFPLAQSNLLEITKSRHRQRHRRLTLLLDLLLLPRISLPPQRPEHFWAVVSHSDTEFDIRYVQQFYFAEFGDLISEQPSTPTAERLQELAPEEYCEITGNDGSGLRVPADLDDQICRYLALPIERRTKFDRALFWLDMASLQWNISFSASFAALVSAIEVLTERGSRHSFICPKCDEQTQHETPGATRRFVDFFETYASGGSLKKQREKMYGLRSGILHGSKLMQYDEDIFFGWAPNWLDEYELQSMLWRLTRIALRNWMENPDRV